MTIDYGQDIFALGFGQTIDLVTIFNSHDFNEGGDYVGPLAVAGIANGFRETMTPSTIGVEAIRPHITPSKWAYHYSIRNDSQHNTTFVIHFFYN